MEGKTKKEIEVIQFVWTHELFVVIQNDFWKNLPKNEIEHIRKLCIKYQKLSESAKIWSTLSDKNLAARVCTWRRLSLICACCGKQGPVKNREYCSNCKITFYCDVKCASKDWRKHKKWCCKKTAEFLTPPYFAVKVVSTKNKVGVNLL